LAVLTKALFGSLHSRWFARLRRALLGGSRRQLVRAQTHAIVLLDLTKQLSKKQMEKVLNELMQCWQEATSVGNQLKG
jgi:hypothetical protein